MKVGFIGLGRMGEVMTRRLIEAGHEVGVYNRNADKAKPLVDAGARAVGSIKAAAQFGDAVFTMVSDDAAVLQVVGQPGGLKDSLPKGGIHICAGTHSVGAIQKLKEIHAEAGQILIASPMLGRPEVVAAGLAGTVVGGPPDVVARCRPLFTAIAPRVVDAGPEPAGAAVIKIANNFVLGCAIEALGEGFCADTQIRRRAGRVLRRPDRRPVQLLGLQELRQDHRRSKISAGRPARHERAERRQPRARRRRSGRRAVAER